MSLSLLFAIIKITKAIYLGEFAFALYYYQGNQSYLFRSGYVCFCLIGANQKLSIWVSLSLLFAVCLRRLHTFASVCECVHTVLYIFNII